MENVSLLPKPSSSSIFFALASLTLVILGLIYFSGILKPLVIAFLISIPVTWYMMNQWLNDFAYRTAIGIDPFLSSAGITLLVILFVVGYHAFRASRMNPIKSLRVE